jgi:endoglucanase
LIKRFSEIRSLEQKVTILRTVSPHDDYPEAEWWGDMELGAAELYRAMAMGGISENSFAPSHYLELSGHWAGAYLNSSKDGDEFLRLYDVAALAHRELYLAMRQAGVSTSSGVSIQGSARGCLLETQPRREAGRKGSVRARHDIHPMGTCPQCPRIGAGGFLLLRDVSCLDLCRLRTGSDRLSFRRERLGTSFVVGAGKTWPHCIHHQIANLSGSLDGTPPMLLGATVAGPVPRAALKHIEDEGMDGMQFCAGSAFDDFSGQGRVTWMTSDPSLRWNRPSTTPHSPSSCSPAWHSVCSGCSSGQGRVWGYA